MSSAVAERSVSPEAHGAQRPSVLWLPDDATGAGQEAVELAAMAGLTLDPWQEFVLVNALSEKPGGQWSAFEVGIDVPRQNGKGGILEARELAGLYLLSERLLIHSAHQFDTSLEAFRRLLILIEDTPDLERRVKRVTRSHGEEGIELMGGQRIRFRTRTKGGGRGFSADCLILDEAMYIPEAMHGALLPTLSARPNPQVWYAGSAVDQWVHENGVVFARVRERGHAGGDQGLAWFEWSVANANPEWVDVDSAEQLEAWARANPGLGIRITPEHIEQERRSMDPRTFAVERLGVGDWPSTRPEDDAVIAMDKWKGCADKDSKPGSPLVFTFDVTPNRSRGAIAVGGAGRIGRRTSK
jgi:phage terminase large subunit-like protein